MHRMMALARRPQWHLATARASSRAWLSPAGPAWRANPSLCLSLSSSPAPGFTKVSFCSEAAPATRKAVRKAMKKTGGKKGANKEEKEEKAEAAEKETIAAEQPAKAEDAGSAKANATVKKPKKAAVPKLELRDYQKECVKTCMEMWKEGEEQSRRQLVSLPVGSGKTVILSEIMRQLTKKEMDVTGQPDAKRFLLLAHRAELLDQAYAVIRRVCPKLKIGIDRAEQRCDVEKVDVVLASVQTLGRNVEVSLAGEETAARKKAEKATENSRLDAYDAKMFKAVFIDEAHHATSPTYLRILDFLGVRRSDSHVKLWGCTATAKRHDGVALGSVFTTVPYYVSPVQLMDEGYLSQVKAWRVYSQDRIDGEEAVPALQDRDDEMAGLEDRDFTQNQLSGMNTPERNDLVVSAYHQLVAPERKSTLVFACSIAHCYALMDTFQAYFDAPEDKRWSDTPLHISRAGDTLGEERKSSGGICRGNSRQVAVVTGSTPSEERVNTVERFRRGEVAVLINVGVFTEGTDLPVTDSLVLARPTASANLYYQMLGRGLRVHPGKDDCLVLDIVDLLAEHIGDLRQLTAPELFGIPPSYQTFGKSLRHVYDEYNTWLQQRLAEDKADEDERNEQQAAEAKILPMQWKDLKYDQEAVVSIDEFAEFDWVAIRREGSSGPTYYCPFSSGRAKLGYLELAKEVAPKTVAYVPPLAYAWDGRHKAGVEEVAPAVRIDEGQEELGLHPSIRKPDLAHSFDAAMGRGKKAKEEEEDTSYEALVGVSATIPDDVTGPPTRELFRATFRRPGAAKTAKPMQVGLGSDLRQVLRASEEFLDLNFPNELLMQRKDAEWRDDPPTEGQLQFSLRLRQHPTSKGEVATTARIRQLRKVTTTRVREVTSAYMLPDSDDVAEGDDELNYLLQEDDEEADGSEEWARGTVAKRQHQWFEAYKKKKPLTFLLPLTFREYTAIEVSQNMLSLWDVWKIVGSDRKMMKLTKKVEKDVAQKMAEAAKQSDSPIDLKSLKGALLLAEAHVRNVAPKSSLRFLTNPRKAKWKLEPATEKQKAYLQSMGYEGDDIDHLSKGQISRLIARYEAGRSF